MRRDQLEHGIRASSAIANEDAFVIIGTAAILAQHPELSEEVLTTHEIDIWPLSGSEDSSNTLECIGEHSVFHTTHEFFIDPYNPSNAALPEGWKDRLIQVKTEATKGAVGLCAEKHDVCVSKLARGEPKDLIFIRALSEMGLLDSGTMLERIEMVDPATPHYQHEKESPLSDIRKRMRANFEKAVPSSFSVNTTPILPQAPSRGVGGIG